MSNVSAAVLSNSYLGNSTNRPVACGLSRPIYPQVPCRYPIDGNRNFITNPMQNA